jgi:hypothetical protein
LLEFDHDRKLIEVLADDVGGETTPEETAPLARD